ncbi:MAG: prephenate dehydratase [Spongiibacteraceae bacterium]|nr:prephenate dehydratase [Spongiibacteraceae bacterium]
MSEKSELEQLRADIDAIDATIQDLLGQRAQCAQRVAQTKLKAMEGEDGQADLSTVMFYRPEREAQVLQKVKERNNGPLSDNSVAHIFREIMSACLALEKPMEVAYLGPEGTFTQAATVKHFGHAVVSISQPTIANVFSQVESGQCHYGVVPVENSTEGMVSHTLDNFMDSPVKICGEVELRIQLHLLASSNASMDNIKTICAHQQALGQCRHWLDTHWPAIERVAVSSNAEAARMAQQDNTIAAVAGDIAQEQYNLTRLASSIEDCADNTTRFLIIGKEAIPVSGNDKTSMVISTYNKPGALFKLLEPFQREGVSLTRIDTRPSRTDTWAYVFFIECEGHQDDSILKRVLDGLEENSMILKLLGSYPKAVL